MINKKKINVEKDSICGICRLSIMADDEHVAVTHYRAMKILSIGYYHIKCFRDKISDTGHLKAQAQSLIDKTNLVLNRFAMEN